MSKKAKQIERVKNTPPPPPKQDDVIILAKGETKYTCPFDAEETWVVNDVMLDPKFEKESCTLTFRFDPTTPEFAKRMKTKAPIISWQPYADIKYPLDEIIEEFGTEYFSNTISYMIAYAIYKKIPQVRLYGVDAPYGGIYDIERSGIEYWMGRAAERGTKIIPCEGSHLLRPIQGSIYGTGREGQIQLYFAERLIINNTLPLKGHFREMDACNLARFIVMPKDQECKENGVKILRNPNGQVQYQCGKEFATKVWMPLETWEWMYKYYKGLDEKGELPVEATTIYKKLVLLTEGGEQY